MTTAKARIIGIIYTFIFATVQSIAVVLLLFWLGDLEYSKIYDEKVPYFFLDRGIPVIFIFTIYFARNLGIELILGKTPRPKIPVILMNIGIGATTFTFTWFYLLHIDFDFDQSKDYLATAGVIALITLFLYLSHILPSLFLANKLEWLISRDQPKQP